jgi:integrase
VTWRHSRGVRFRVSGVPVDLVSGLLRHSQISMTMDICTHVVDEDQRAAAAQLADLLRGQIPDN